MKHTWMLLSNSIVTIRWQYSVHTLMNLWWRWCRRVHKNVSDKNYLHSPTAEGPTLYADCWVVGYGTFIYHAFLFSFHLSLIFTSIHTFFFFIKSIHTILEDAFIGIHDKIAENMFFLLLYLYYRNNSTKLTGYLAVNNNY